jgi:uncharacterized delta-60 repeat protein
MGGYTYNSSEDITFVRLNTDGSLDTSFAAGGVLNMVFNGTNEHIDEVLVQDDGKILGIGNISSGGNKMIFVRLTEDGILDNTFSNDGMLTVEFGSGYESYGRDLAIQDDGKIIGAGYVTDLNNDAHCALCRINADGSMDATFGTNGIMMMNLNGNDNYMNNVALLDDNILVGGRSRVAANEYNLTLARFTPQGLLDNTFGINGTVNIELENTPVVIGPSGTMCLDGNNRILFGIYQEGILNNNIAIYRFLSNGTPDGDFGDYGLRVVVTDGDSYSWSITTQLDNKVIVGGITVDNGGTLVRLTEDGDPDPDFGSDGIGVVIDSEFIGYTGLNIQDDGKIIASGYTPSDIWAVDFITARYFSGLDVGLNEQLISESNITIYPNPAQAWIKVDIPTGENIEQITIYNQLGMPVLKKAGITKKVDISALPEGVFIVEIQTGHSTFLGKFIKKR